MQYNKIISKLVKLVLFFAVIYPTVILSQYLEDDSAAFHRADRFWMERKFPYDSIPLDAYQNALDFRDQRRMTLGFHPIAPGSWIPLGPNPGILNTSENYGYVSGRAKMVHFSHANGNIVYIATATGGLWKSLNVWESPQENVEWTPITWNNNVVKYLAGGAFLIDPYDPTGNTIYLGTGEAIDFTPSYPGDGIYKSTDGGVTWIKGNGLPLHTKVYKIAVRGPDYRNELLAALGTTYWINQYAPREGGVFRSVDGGLNWFQVQGTEGRHCFDVAYSPIEESNLAYCIGPPYEDVWWRGTNYRRSYDGGVTFIEEPNAFQPYAVDDRSLLEISPSNPNIIYALTVVNGCLRAFKSTNAGANFTIIEGTQFQTQVNYCTYIRVTPWDENLVFIGGEDLWRSTNGGSNWHRMTCAYWFNCSGPNRNVHADHHYLDFPPRNIPDYQNKYLITTDGGVYRTSNAGVSFENLNKSNNPDKGLNSITFYTLACDPFKVSNMVGGAQDNCLQHRYLGNNEWIARDFGDFSSTCFNIAKPKNLTFYMLNNGGRMFYSLDGGYTYNNTNYGTGLSERPALVSHPTEQGVFYSAKLKLLKTTDGGYNWFDPFPQTGSIDPENRGVNAIDVCNSDLIYAATNHFDALLPENNIQKLFKTTNAGQNWVDLEIETKGVPNRWITSIKSNPAEANEVLITLTGFSDPYEGSRHVYRSTNQGGNWENITGNLEDIPVNDLLIRYAYCNVKEYIVATDIGVFASDASDPFHTWYELGRNLPNSATTNLQLHKFSQKLRIGTFGIGAWELPLQGPIFVRDVLVLNSYPEGLNVDYDIIVCTGGKILIPEACTIKMKEDSKITILDGGQIIAESGNPITITSQSGTWGGIEFQGTGSGTLRNITFLNTSTPVEITESAFETPPEIIIDECIFNAPVSINSRNKVRIMNCDWSYNTQPGAIACVSSVNSDEVDISYNTLTSSQFLDATGIAVSYGETITITGNSIQDCDIGISVSNSSAVVVENQIYSNYPSSAAIGIWLDFAYSSFVNKNIVTNYQTGIKMLNSSPTMHYNQIINNNYSSPFGIDCQSNSYPRLAPTEDQPFYRWDAGYNFIFQSDPSAQTTSIYIYDYSMPNIQMGWNTIHAQRYYIDGRYYIIPGPEYAFPAQCNYWSESPPNTNKFNLEDGGVVVWDPYDCELPGGEGGAKKNEGEMNVQEPSLVRLPKTELLDPPPMIIYYGNGRYDTIKVTTANFSSSADKTAYYQGIKNELLGNYNASLPYYYQVIQNYQDSLTAIYSLKRIIRCKDKLNADTTGFASLRAYYRQLAQNNPTDTSFSNVAEELAIKCLVRMHRYPAAITEYEDLISSTTDSLKILGAELNIIETYMLIQQGGDLPSFTGKIPSLKPKNIIDGFRMLREKIIGKSKTKPEKLVPREFKLFQNYPNPFNPFTTIKYSLPHNTKVTIKIFDILGRLVKELVNEYKEAGYYEIKFDGTNLASGIYFYKIEAGTFVDTKKMVLVK